MKQVLTPMTRLVTSLLFQQPWTYWPLSSLFSRHGAARPVALLMSRRRRASQNREARRNADARVISGV